MTERKIKIWSGLGRYVLAGTGLALASPAAADTPRLADVPAAHAGPTQLAETAKPAEKPHQHEGGEGGEQGNAIDAPPDEAFMLRLLLIKGHLKVGRELVEQTRWNDALPHFLHPAEEIYKSLAPALAERKIAPFDQDLAALAALVKAKKGAAEVIRAQEALLAKLAAVPRSPPSPPCSPPSCL